jgi:acyl-CoA reductase-like NAD-dependent aldehyde dehydrogenase
MIPSQLEHLIGGRWTASDDGRARSVTSPVTGDVIGDVAEGGRAEARAAIAAADTAFSAWERRSPFERAALLHRAADVAASRRDELARLLTLEQGKPLHAEAYDEIDEIGDGFRQAAEDVKRFEGRLGNSFTTGRRAMIIRRPLGVIGVITPWNFPHGSAVTMIAPALAAGNTVVWTPAPTTTISAVALGRCIEEAGLPPGVFNLVLGPGPVVGNEIAANPRVRGVGFIGSTATGHLVAQAAVGKALVLELGGNGPMVVLDDADVAAAAEATISACFLCSGQSCTAGERLLVHRSVRDEFVERVAGLVAQRVVLGDPFVSGTTLGPLNNRAVAEKMDAHVADAVDRGAVTVAGGAVAAGFPTDLYWEPTILDAVSREAILVSEETFGPIAPVIEIESLDDAVDVTNASPYGLLAAVFTSRLERGLEFADRVRTGWVNINESSNYAESHLPGGGRAGSASGIGRVGGQGQLEAFTETQTVTF